MLLASLLVLKVKCLFLPCCLVHLLTIPCLGRNVIIEQSHGGPKIILKGTYSVYFYSLIFLKISLHSVTVAKSISYCLLSLTSAGSSSVWLLPHPSVLPFHFFPVPPFLFDTAIVYKTWHFPFPATTTTTTTTATTALTTTARTTATNATSPTPPQTTTDHHRPPRAVPPTRAREASGFFFVSLFKSL